MKPWWKYTAAMLDIATGNVLPWAYNDGDEPRLNYFEGDTLEEVYGFFQQFVSESETFAPGRFKYLLVGNSQEAMDAMHQWILTNRQDDYRKYVLRSDCQTS